MQALVVGGGAALAVGAVFALLFKSALGGLERRFQHSLDQRLQQDRFALELQLEYDKRAGEFALDAIRDLWLALLEVQRTADALWQSASLQRLQAFRDAVRMAQLISRDSSPQLDPGRLEEIDALLARCREFIGGKGALLSMYQWLPSTHDDITKRIEGNREIKDDLESAIARMRTYLSRQLQSVADERPSAQRRGPLD